MGSVYLSHFLLVPSNIREQGKCMHGSVKKEENLLTFSIANRFILGIEPFEFLDSLGFESIWLRMIVY